MGTSSDKVVPLEAVYVDRTPLEISEDYGGELIIHNRPPWKEIILAITLLAFGLLGIAAGAIMVATMSGANKARGIVYCILGALLFLPGFYESRIAYYAFKGYRGFSFANIPAV
eukprot:TRINITY_DN94_c0_g1_i1.p1 TRINITY_DN94_c0_g1~~TRINITY_DN94_c0_g1_i1.p1  ORF type:complete len:114 (-),score=18.93 TRINITY_DN94_c0_g1_i1:727-1068(-)